MDSSNLDLLPMLVADLASDEARGYLESVAIDGRTVIVPLVSPPVDSSPHILEVSSPGFEQTLVLIAEPVGAPTAEGFPLRLSLPDGDLPRAAPTTPAAANEAAPGPARPVEPRRKTAQTISERHERRLTTGQLPQPARITGRKLAAGKLVIESFIGAGGAGAVYKAVHRELQIPVAVKVLHEDLQRNVDFCRRFHAEALAASRLDHANLTRVIDFGQEDDGTLYLAMEYLDGRVLRDVLDQEKRLSLPRILGIMAQVCAGLAHAHARGVLHRDVKPENAVLLPSIDDDGRPFELVKVCDFGIAQQPAELSDLAGTPEYMSPEQCAGEELDARTDVYACGILLYELATGIVPFTGDTPAKIANRQMYTAPEPPSRHAPDIDRRLEAIILRSLAKDRADRPANMRDLRSMLRALLRPSSMAQPAMAGASPSPPTVAAVASSLASTEDHAGTEPDPHASTEPEWIERSGSWAAVAREPSPKPPLAAIEDPVAAGLVRDPTPILGELVRTTEPHAFHKLAVMVDPAIRALAGRGESAALWRLVSTLDVLADEGPRTPGSRAAMAALLLRIAYDPQVLGPIAEEALLSERQTLDAAWKLVVRAALGGAYALYSARLKHVTPEARTRFVRLYRQIGAPVLPIVRAGLERLVPKIESDAAADLASDLLASVPSVADEATGEIVALYARAKSPVLARAAAPALAKLWGPRASASLLGLLSHKDEGAQCAAIAGLVEIHAVDEPVARKLANVVGPAGRGTAARVAAIDALAQAEPSALAFAGRALRRMLAASTGWPDEMAVAVARSLLAAGGGDDRALIVEQSRVWPPSVQVAVAGLVRGTNR